MAAPIVSQSQPATVRPATGRLPAIDPANRELNFEMPCFRLARMARKASSSEVRARGFGDIIGIVLIMVSVLTLVALAPFSYDPRDVPATSTAPNVTTHNWIGQIGAWLGYLLFFLFGASAYLLPVILFCFVLSYLFQLMAYFHR